MTYNTFFQIHIPKTGGTYFKKNILKQITKTLNNNNVTIADEKDLGLHLCWFKPLIQKETYLYTTLRDPVKRLINQFCHQAESSILQKTTNYNISDINKNSFYSWLENNTNMYKNIQSKSLVYFNENKTTYAKATNLRWEDGSSPKMDHFMFDQNFINYEINQKNLFQNIKRIDFIAKAEDFSYINNQSAIIKKILYDLNITDKTNYLLSETSSNIITENIFSKLSKIQINKLYDYQNLDSEIYFSNIYTKY
jgi:hypothetical protein